MDKVDDDQNAGASKRRGSNKSKIVLINNPRQLI